MNKLFDPLYEAEHIRAVNSLAPLYSLRLVGFDATRFYFRGAPSDASLAGFISALGQRNVAVSQYYFMRDGRLVLAAMPAAGCCQACGVWPAAPGLLLCAMCIKPEDA